MDSQDKIKQKKNPRETANIISICFFWWMNSLMGEGYKKELELEDLFEARKEDESEFLGSKLERHWNSELERVERSRGEKKGTEYKPSLAKAILKSFGPFYLCLGACTFIEECGIRVFQPLFMGWLIQYFSPDSQVTLTEAYLYGAGVVAMAAAYTFTHHPYFFGVMYTGMKVRVACCSLLYRKALRLSNTALGQTTVGQMVNLLSNDVNRFDTTVLFNHYLWAGPLQLIIITYLLCQRIGPSALVGAGLLVAAVPLQSWIGKQFGRLRVQTAGKTDKRIRLMNEIVNGIKVIKMYCWEKPFSLLVQEARKNEIDVVRRTCNYRAFNFSFFFTASRFILLCTFIVFALTGNVLTAEKAFLVASMFNTVRLSMTLFFPFAISQIGEARVSVGRIQDFLMLQEKDEKTNIVSIQKSNVSLDQSCPTVTMENITGKWNPQETEETLENVNLKTKPGQLLAIIGSVGSGKTSVLHAILGEFPCSSGKISVSGNIAYSPQEAWVFSGSVRQNIIFGKPFDPERYRRVLAACALEHDLNQWEFGDRTLVGERGVALSGGQKARVSLARAVYREADTYLLDDPLSAVDVHVGRHLFSNCIRGFLEKKAVILVTHQLQYLQEADEIIVLKNGKVEQRGDFKQLVQSGMDFSVFLAQDSTEEKVVMKNPVARNRTFSNVSESHSVRSEISMATAINDVTSTVDEDDEVKEIVPAEDPKQEKEMRSSGSVKAQVYYKYLSSGGGVFSLILTIAMNITCQLLYSGSDIWLSYWTTKEEMKMEGRMGNISNENLILPPPSSRSNQTVYGLDLSVDGMEDHFFNLGVFAAIVLSLCLLSMIRTVHFFKLCMSSSVALHNAVFQRILRAPCRFFDTNPVGRILNRFSKDMGSMDELLPPALFDVISIGLNIAGILAVIFSVRPWVILPTLVLGVVFVWLRTFYMHTSRDVKRLEGISRSPVFSQLSTSLQGLTTIRAFNAEPMLRSEFDYQQDLHTSTWFAFLSSTRWFGVWLDWIVCVYIGVVVYSFLLLGGDIVGGDVGLAISNCIMLTGMLQWGVRQSAEVENLMTAVERVMEYSQLDQEAEATKEECLPPPNWPNKGVIEFDDVSLRYAPEEKEVLRGVSFKTRKHEKIGIVGRTGAGKSSLLTALFRLAEPTGSIVIDGIETLNIGLDDLRNKISIIPQDPLLFTGSLRRNLDPFEEHSDDKIWQVLREVHLAEPVSDLKMGLETEMSEGGSNFSVGQRQLVCLARAVLRQNSILVLDEATANVDPQTDALIQEAIRERFLHCTVLTIAHRLHTIMDCDRILVMSDGSVAQFGQPYSLLTEEEGGILSDLVTETGPASSQRLRDIARAAYFRSVSNEEEERTKL